jgi:hypothetical protein
MRHSLYDRPARDRQDIIAYLQVFVARRESWRAPAIRLADRATHDGVRQGTVSDSGKPN